MVDDNLEEMSYDEFEFSPYDLNQFDKREYFFGDFSEEEFNPYDLNQVGGFRNGGG